MYCYYSFLHKQFLIVIFLSFHCSLGTALLRQARLDSKVRKPDGGNIPTVKGNTSKAIEKKGHLPPISRGKNSSANTPDINQQSKDYSPKEVYVTPDEPFEGQIRNNSMYRWVYLPKSDNFKPEEVVNRSDMPFEKQHPTIQVKQHRRKDTCLQSYVITPARVHMTSISRAKTARQKMCM